MTQPDNEEVDLQLVADGYRVISDPAAWDDLIGTWNAKLKIAGFDTVGIQNEERLERQYAKIASLLKRIGLPEIEDPIVGLVKHQHEPAMVLSRNLRVLAINEAGQKAFGAEQGIAANLSWLSPEHMKTFDGLLRDLGRRRADYYAIMRAQDATEGRSYVEVFTPRTESLREPVIVVRALATHWTAAMSEALRIAFDLTSAEIDIAVLLYRHADLSTVAELRGASLRTVRTQLSRIFAKTDTRGQVELVRLLSHLSGRLGARVENSAVHWEDPAGQEQVLTRPDGRKLAYTWLGPKQGRPVLLVPGIVNGYLFPDGFSAVLLRRNIRLIVMTRPGAGNSDRDPEANPLGDHIEAIRFLTKKLNLSGLPAVGIHGANVALLEIAASNDNPFSEVVAIGRFLPLDSQRWRKLPAMPRVLIWLQLHARWAADIVGQHGWRNVVRQGLDWYINRAYGDMPFDYGFTSSPEVSALLRNACAYTFRQSHHVMLEDLEIRQNDIVRVLPLLKVRLTWLLGAVEVYTRDAEASPFYSQAELDRIAAINPLIDIHRIPEAADLIVYQQPRLIAEMIADAVDRAEGIKP
ncbi:MAG: helix-turn-helix transcriptional regulator [Rhodobacteraceae bacterium]|nr:helix-turn-helix transcriptional regulator [Paracoccaceae bacterium]